MWGLKLMTWWARTSKLKKGLRQGDPLSSLLFNIVVDMLAILINRAKDEGQFNGVVPHLVDDGHFILQYVDDTIIFLDHDLSSARNLKLLLCAFENLLGHKINFHKSEVFLLQGSKRHVGHMKYERSFTGASPFSVAMKIKVSS
jgi:hypothetical protein